MSKDDIMTENNKKHSVQVFSKYMHFNMPDVPKLEDVILLTQVLSNKTSRNSQIKRDYVKIYDEADSEFNIIFNKVPFKLIQGYAKNAYNYNTLFVRDRFILHTEAFDTIYAYMQQKGSIVIAPPTYMSKFKTAYKPIYCTKNPNRSISVDMEYNIYKEYLFHLLDLEIIKLSKFICDELLPISMMRLDMLDIYGNVFINKCALKSSGNNHISKELGISVSLYKKLIKNAIEEYVENVNDREAIKSSEFGSRFRIKNLYDINNNHIEIYFEEIQTKGQKLIKDIFGYKVQEDIVKVDKSRATPVVDIGNIMPASNSKTMQELKDRKSNYSKLALDATCDVLYEVLYIRRMLKLKKHLKETSEKSYGEFKANLLLELNTIENTKVGAPIFVFLDDETDYEMLKKAVTIATNPVLRHINLTDNPISLSFDYQEEAKTVVIGVIYEKEEK